MRLKVITNNHVVDRINKLKTIHDLIRNPVPYYYDLLTYCLPPYNEEMDEINEHSLKVLSLAKEKIIELENEIKNATSKTTNA